MKISFFELGKCTGCDVPVDAGRAEPCATRLTSYRQTRLFRLRKRMCVKEVMEPFQHL